MEEAVALILFQINSIEIEFKIEKEQLPPFQFLLKEINLMNFKIEKKKII